MNKISFKFDKGNEKIALIGKVGSGKTTLLHTILNETYLLKGEGQIRISNGLISYAE